MPLHLRSSRCNVLRGHRILYESCPAFLTSDSSSILELPRSMKRYCSLPPSTSTETTRQVNDWGWKMIVTPVMGKINALNLPSPVLDSKLASLLRICRDCPKEQVQKNKRVMQSWCSAVAEYCAHFVLLWPCLFAIK